MMMKTAVESGTLATFHSSEQFLVHSERAGADYLIQVAAPVVMQPASPDHRFPVVYVTDGEWMFPPASAIGIGMNEMIEGAYIVGIGYPENVEAMPDGGPAGLPAGTSRWRFRDLMHNPDPPPPSFMPPAPPGSLPPGGGGAAFEAFLMEELRPLIESTYPVDPQRAVLVGHSLGGLFTAMVLSHQPGAFAGYIIGSPAMWIEPALPARIAAVAPKATGAKVFIGVGELEPPFIPMADDLEAALTGPDSAFDVRRETFSNEGHNSLPPLLIGHGLRHILPGPVPRGTFADLPSQ